MLLDPTGYGMVEITRPLGTYQITLHGQWIVLGAEALAPGAVTVGVAWPQ